MALTLNQNYKVFFPDKTADVYDTYLGTCVGLHTDSNDSNNNYSIVSVSAKGTCEYISTADESKRVATLS